MSWRNATSEEARDFVKDSGGHFLKGIVDKTLLTRLPDMILELHSEIGAFDKAGSAESLDSCDAIMRTYCKFGTSDYNWRKHCTQVLTAIVSILLERCDATFVLRVDNDSNEHPWIVFRKNGRELDLAELVKNVCFEGKTLGYAIEIGLGYPSLPAISGGITSY